jgi:hypothetical protein
MGLLAPAGPSFRRLRWISILWKNLRIRASFSTPAALYNSIGVKFSESLLKSSFFG